MRGMLQQLLWLVYLQRQRYVRLIDPFGSQNITLCTQRHINSHFSIQVLRDGQWQEQDASILVPGDIISIKLGDIVPADARLLEGDPLKIDQACARKSKCKLFFNN